MTRPWLGDLVGLRDELQSLAPQARLSRLNELASLAGLRTASGHFLQFLPQDAVGPDQPYELHIDRTGEVPTRTVGDAGLHDLYNALMWLAWPCSKAAVNALHVQALAAGGVRRGPLRDALTLFDEGGLVWACASAELNQALREFQWLRLFGQERERVRTQVGVRVFGHALLQKLERPYKAITAHAWVLVTSSTDAGALDAQLAQSLNTWASALLSGTGQAASRPQDGPDDPGPLRPAARFCPLPVLGLPGWWTPNESPDFYLDTGIFRPGRVRRLQSGVERVGRSLRGPASAEEGPDSGGQGAG